MSSPLREVIPGLGIVSTCCTVVTTIGDS